MVHFLFKMRFHNQLILLTPFLTVYMWPILMFFRFISSLPLLFYPFQHLQSFLCSLSANTTFLQCQNFYGPFPPMLKGLSYHSHPCQVSNYFIHRFSTMLALFTFICSLVKICLSDNPESEGLNSSQGHGFLNKMRFYWIGIE